MAVRIIIGGKSKCQLFAEVCLMADYLSKELPTFCYERIEKSHLEWQAWLRKVNKKNGWNHTKSPIVWKEFLYKGSKPHYIGGASEFFEHCHAYYNFDFYMDPNVFEGLNKNFNQYRQKVKFEFDYPSRLKPKRVPFSPNSPKLEFRIAIFGGDHALTIPLISSLVDIYSNARRISRIYVFDEKFSDTTKETLLNECKYIGHKLPSKLVKYVDIWDKPLKKADMLIVLKHVPFDDKIPLGDWLFLNAKLILYLGLVINATALHRLYIVFANLGPACFNATMLSQSLIFNRENIVVATSGLALDVLQTVSELTAIPIGNIFCPPVWGFVGINHLVDIKNTFYKYNSFYPYERYRKVRNSTLTIGTITPEIRTLEHLVYFEENLWQKVAERRNLMHNDQEHFYVVEAIVNIVKKWVFDPDPNVIVSLGVSCDGTFGLTFQGIFSQPCQLIDNTWVPAEDYMLPKDPQVNLYYLEGIAKMVMELQKDDLPPIKPYELVYRLPPKRRRSSIITWNLDNDKKED